MGAGASRQKSPKTPVPQYVPPGTALPPSYPPYQGMTPYPAGSGYSPPLNKRQQKELFDAYNTIQKLQNRSYSVPRSPGSTLPPPLPYNGPPVMNVSQPSPPLQRAMGAAYQPPPPPYGIGYRDTDYAAVANIAGLNPADVALLHREYINLTRGGRNKLDRVVFRQLLRDVLLEANNEHIDRALENIFVSIDRNHDGFIDFPEFIGAFRDVLRGDPTYQQDNFRSPLLDILNDPLRGNLLGSALQQPITFLQQPQQAAQVISIPNLSIPSQAPAIYNGTAPLVVSVDSNPISNVVNIPGQHTSLQCVPLPI